MRTLVAAAVLGSVLAGPSSPALAQDIGRLGPRATGVGEALRAAATGSSATRLNPAGVALSRSYVVEGNIGLRPEKDATSAAVSICDSSTARIGACLYYDYLGADPAGAGGSLTLHEVGITTAFPIADRVFLGATNKYVDWDGPAAGDDDSGKGYLLDLGLVARVGSMLQIATVAHNLIGADEMFPRALGGGLALFPIGTLMVSGDARYAMETETWRYGAGGELFLTGGGGEQGFPIRGGYVYDDSDGASYVSGGAGYITPRVGIDAGIRKQIDKGDEVLVELGLRLFIPN